MDENVVQNIPRRVLAKTETVTAPKVCQRVIHVSCPHSPGPNHHAIWKLIHRGLTICNLLDQSITSATRWCTAGVISS
jgi:hypothetical protein